MTETKKAETPAAHALPDGYAICRVLKAGDGKIATGSTAVEDDGVSREQFHAKGAEFVIPQAIADALEDRGFVEIQ